ncbi:MAG: right-handed parallel beta-helix repeat-containing protein, partial [Bacteroidota bacterium]
MNISFISCRKRFESVHYRLSLLWMKPWIILSCCTITGCSSYFINPPRIALETVIKKSSQQAPIIISNNSIYQNNRSGIRTRGNMPIHIEKNNIYQNGQGGINLNYSARVSITDCTISQNRNSGISADNPIHVQINGNRILQNVHGGIRIRSNKQPLPIITSASINNNSIFLNKDGGIFTVSDTSLPTRLHISGNSIYRN